MRLNPIPQNPDTIVTGIPQSGFAMNEGDGAYADGPGLPHVNKVVMVMDLVESVRLMALDESGVVARWTGFVRKAEKLIPRYNGRVVKSLGDGLLADFDTARDAALAAAALHKIIQPANRGRNPDQHLFLRIGINAAKVYTGQDELYGAGVNLAARLATLAGPGETMVSASVRDQLTDGLDVDVEDMGECYLKHIETPVRAYRIGPPGPRPVLVPERDYAAQLQPTIAVIPFTSRSNAPEHFAIGELIADGVIGHIVKTPHCRVISRLSSTRLRDHDNIQSTAFNYLKANYTLTGSYKISSNKILVNIELTEAAQNIKILENQFLVSISSLLDIECDLYFSVAYEMQERIMSFSLSKIDLISMPTLPSYSLMLSGIGLMHRTNQADFNLSRDVLLSLIERHDKISDLYAWLAKWHVLRATRGLAVDIQNEADQALELTTNALNLNPRSSFALAMEGFVYFHLKKDINTAKNRLELASQINPNESLAWLFLSVVYSFLGEVEHAMSASLKAMVLSPLDPIKYYYESLTATSFLAAGNFSDAIILCESSLKKNKLHAPTMRTLIASYVAIGNIQKAKLVAKDLIRLAPGFTVSFYRTQSAGARFQIGSSIADAMEIAGIPLN
jgi:adenylate cyclase